MRCGCPIQAAAARLKAATGCSPRRRPPQFAAGPAQARACVPRSGAPAVRQSWNTTPIAGAVADPHRRRHRAHRRREDFADRRGSRACVPPAGETSSALTDVTAFGPKACGVPKPCRATSSSAALLGHRRQPGVAGRTARQVDRQAHVRVVAQAACRALRLGNEGERDRRPPPPAAPVRRIRPPAGRAAAAPRRPRRCCSGNSSRATPA